jgi:lactate permease
VLGAQGFGAAAGNAICPHNVIAAGATMGLERREGVVIGKTLKVIVPYAALGGVLALALTVGAG